ncbi:MAG: hypothetical protein ACREC8_13100, partial [Limisphaerales bacterium]
MFFSAMKLTSPQQTKRKSNVAWVKTPYPNLIRYKPSGTYFGRVRVNGKLIRRSLETHVLTVARLKLSDFLQDHRRLAVNKGQSVKGEVIIEMFRKERPLDSVKQQFAATAGTNTRGACQTIGEQNCDAGFRVSKIKGLSQMSGWEPAERLGMAMRNKYLRRAR